MLDPYYPFTTSYGTDPEEDLELGQYLSLIHILDAARAAAAYIGAAQEDLAAPERGISPSGSSARSSEKDGAKAVSYTHLDVYKRQLLPYAGYPGLCA